MSQRKPDHQTKSAGHSKRVGFARQPEAFTPSPALTQATIQRALTDPRRLAPSEMLQLQRTVGNQAVQRMLQRDSQAGFEAGGDFESRLKQSSGGGSVLPQSTKSEFEASFGANFDNVRIHTNAASNQLNRSIQAKAFTHGNDIHFGAGEYKPASSQGKHLLAHELTHTIQQTGGMQTKGVQTKLQVGAAQNRYEQEADRVAAQVMQPKRLQGVSPTQAASPLPIQRKLDFTAAQLSGGDAISDKYYAMTGEQETYVMLKQMLNRYHQTDDPMEQVRILERMNALGSTWLNKHDPNKPGSQKSKADRFMRNAKTLALGESNKSKKSFSLHFLVASITKELPEAYQTAAKAQDAYANKVESGGMKYLSGKGATAFNRIKGWQTDDQSEQGGKARDAMTKHGLSLAEAGAIGIYSADDFKYMNPTVANNKNWLHDQLPKTEFSNQQIRDEVITGNPNKKADGMGKYAGTDFDQVKAATKDEMALFHQHAEGASAEGMEHTKMALSGLHKLPNWQGMAYRGLVLTPAEFKQKYPPKGNAVMPAFTSTSLREDVPSAFVNENKAEGKVNILLYMQVYRG